MYFTLISTSMQVVLITGIEEQEKKHILNPSVSLWGARKCLNFTVLKTSIMLPSYINILYSHEPQSLLPFPVKDVKTREHFSCACENTKWNGIILSKVFPSGRFGAFPHSFVCMNAAKCLTCFQVFTLMYCAGLWPRARISRWKVMRKIFPSL